MCVSFVLLAFFRKQNSLFLCALGKKKKRLAFRWLTWLALKSRVILNGRVDLCFVKSIAQSFLVEKYDTVT